MQNMSGIGNTAIRKSGQGVVLSILLFLLIGWFSVGHALAERPRLGGTLEFGTENDFAGFEVLQSGSRLAINGAIAANTIMEPLFRMDAEGNMVPVLALSIQPSDDGKAYTIVLRQKVQFHDGTPFNADAIVYHWGRLLNPENKFRGLAAMSVIASVSKIDDFTVKFHLKHAWIPFQKVISSTRGLIDLIPSPKAVEMGTQDRTPVGTGPFKFKAWKSGDSFTVVKNPDYWRKDLPYVDEIIFKPMPDAQTRYASLKSGQLNMIWMDQGNILSKAQADASLKIHSGEDNGAEIFILNTSKPPFDDVNVRRAVAHALNQERQVKMVYNESIPVVHHPFGNSCDCPDDGYREYHPDKARQLLSAYGQPMEIELLHSNSKRGQDIGEITQFLLKEVGITVNPVGLDFGPVVKKVIGGQYQISTWRISSRPDQGPALFLMFHSQSRANYSHYQNPEMDHLLIAQRMETDADKRNKMLCQIARLINEDAPIIYRGGMRSHIITHAEVEGIPPMKDGIVRLEEVWFSQ